MKMDVMSHDPNIFYDGELYVAVPYLINLNVMVLLITKGILPPCTCPHFYLFYAHPDIFSS